MSIPTLVVRSLTLAIGFGLAFSSPAIATQTTLITFGQPTAEALPSAEGVARVSASGLSAADVDRLRHVPPGSVVVTIASDELPLSDADARSFKQLFDGGIPFLLQWHGHAPEDLARVSSLFGIAPTAGDVLLRRAEGGAVTVFSSSPGQAADPATLLTAFGAAEASTQNPAANELLSRPESVMSMSETAGLLPARHFDINFVDKDGEVSGVTGIDVVRSRTTSTDAKMVVITSKATVKTALNGVVDGNSTGKNLWAAYLPTEYRLRHTLSADGIAPTYLDHFPETDGRTEYTQVDSESRGFTIGGSTGAELSSTGKADEMLAAKVPFKASVGYEHLWNTSLSMSFQDYSLLAAPEGRDSVQWKAMIAPRLKDGLIRRWGAEMPQLTEDKMTPMMRTTTFNAMSQWKIPGEYEGMATVSVSAGYTLDREEWWWDRTYIRHRSQLDTRDMPVDFVLDMSDPYLTAEITVLIRSAMGSGACLRDNDGEADLAPCNATDRRQMWGLNGTSQYVNRGSGLCLAVQPVTRSVVTVSCKDPVYEKQWQWRADRLHALSNHSDYRLYVEDGQVRYFAPEGRFQDYPVNPYASQLEPWSNYPNAPRPGIDHQPAPSGSVPLEISEAWASMFRPVSDDQRWRIEILRQGL